MEKTISTNGAKAAAITRKLFTALTLGLLFTACKKDDNIPVPVGPPAQLAVVPNGDNVPLSQVDSAFAIWEAAGIVQRLPLQQVGSRLVTDLANFNNDGPGMLSVQLFTRNQSGPFPLQWERRFIHQLDRSKPVRMAAPSGMNDGAWKPRAVCKSEIYGAGFTAIIALSPEDPYFELQDVSPDVAKRIEIVRSFYNNDTTQLVASRGWTGDVSFLNNRGGLVNREHFLSLPIQINNRQWTKFKVRASFYAELQPAKIYEVEFEQDRL